MNKKEPTNLQRRALNFFDRTRGIKTLSAIYADARREYPGFCDESALRLYFLECTGKERCEASQGETNEN